jgi:hypothetical protein
VSSSKSAATAATGANPATTKVQRAADGDYKVPNARTSHVKDKDGDYKPITAASSAAAQSSSAVQASLSSLKVGG